MKSPTSSLSSRPRRLRDFLQQKYDRIPKKKRHAMLAATCLLWFLVVGVIAGVASLRHSPDGPPGESQSSSTSPSWAPTASPGNISYMMARSIISRKQGIMTTPTEPGAALQAGIVQKAFTAYTAYHGPHPEIQAYVDDSTLAAAELMTHEAADLTSWPLDRLSAGNAMLSDKTGNPTIAAALAALRNTVHLNNVNDEAGLWYWQEYPHWSYLDGMYALGPFVAADWRQGTAGADTLVTTPGISSTHNGTQALVDKVFLQFDLLWTHCRNTTTGLLVHGYDARRSAPWASKVNGASGVVWGRGLGWFAMALVDTIELVWPGWHGGAEGGAADAAAVVPAEQAISFRKMRGMYVSLAMAVLNYYEESGGGGGGWFQVVDEAGREGNYVESSVTAMLAYALLKGARLGYLGADDVPRARAAGLAAHRLLVERYVVAAADEEGDGLLDWAGTVAVCSLNSTATYEYYVGQPVVPNSVLGAAAFVLASVEVERMNDTDSDMTS